MININKVKHILISRIDNIGDVILTLPMTGILKEYFPEIKITFLGRDYVRSIVEHSSHIDGFLSWDLISSLKESEAVAKIKELHIDVMIHVFPKKILGILMKKAGVRYRIAPASRFYYWFNCNERVRFSRKKSDLHEAQLNLNLLKPFNIELNNDLTYLREKIGFHCDEPLPAHLQSLLKSDRFNLIVHPFSNGNTIEWPVSHFNALIRQLPSDRFNIIFTGSKKESEMIQEKIMPHCANAINFAGQCSLRELIQLIAHVDGLVANSTGPLHIAAVLGIHALGLYPVKKGMDIKRWAPLGKKAEVLTADPNCQAPRCREQNDCLCMESITVSQVKNVIMGWM